MTRHRWSEPARLPQSALGSKTERYCLRCGLIKVTRHVDDSGRERGVRDAQGRLVWIEWHRTAGSDGMPERIDVWDGKTPACTPSPCPSPGGRGDRPQRPSSSVASDNNGG